MTIRQAYEAAFINLNKKKAAALYLEDFLVLFKHAVQDHVNLLYALYETSQQLSDDLQNLHRHLIIDVSGATAFPDNVKNFDGTPFVSMDYFGSMSQVGTQFYNQAQNGELTWIGDIKYTTIGVLFGNTWLQSGASLTHNAYLDQIRGGQIEQGTIVKVSHSVYNKCIKLRDYRIVGTREKVQYSIDLKSATEVSSCGHGLLLIWNGFNWERYNELGYSFYNNKCILSSPTNYFHLLGLRSNYDFRKSLTCENYLSKSVGVTKLTSEKEVSIGQNSYLAVKSNRQYFLIKNKINSSYPNIEIQYRADNENNLVKLKSIELIYLKEPKLYSLSDAQLDGMDTSDVIEFQEYICQELVEQVVKLVMENNSDARLQTFNAVNDSNNLSRTTGGSQGKR